MVSFVQPKGFVKILFAMIAYLGCYAVGAHGVHIIRVENWRPATTIYNQPIDPIVEIFGAALFSVLITVDLIKDLIKRFRPIDEKPKGKRKKSRTKE